MIVWGRLSIFRVLNMPEVNIHLISSPDVHPDLMLALKDLLHDSGSFFQIHLPRLRWQYGDLMSINQHRFHGGFRFRIESEYQLEQYDPARGYPLSWRELFYLCEKSRTNLKLPKDDFIIVVTNRRNSLNWFSAFSADGERNAFVQASDWDVFLDSSPEYPVAYEIVANVLRILMKFDLHLPVEQNFHLTALGCVNDFCANKNDILLKLRTADICPECIARLTANGVPEKLISDVLNFFEKIRMQMKFSQGFLGAVQPKAVHISGKGKISIGSADLKLTPLEATLFIFFLQHPAGLRIAELSDHEEELFFIYQRLKSNADPKNIRDLVTKIDGTYSYNKSRLSKKIKLLLGEPLAQHYLISGNPGETFKIPLNRNLVTSDFTSNSTPKPGFKFW